MLQSHELRKRVLWRALGSPLVVAPFLAGMTALTAVWAVGLQPQFGYFAAIAGTLGSAGLYVTRLVFGGERLVRRIIEESRHEQATLRQRALDALDQKLAVADDDPRPETALRDLRSLLRAFEEVEKTTTAPGHLPLVIDLRSRAEQLFDQCVESLQQSARLWKTASGLNDPQVRQPLLDQREHLIAEVQATVKQLSETLAGIQTLGAGAGSTRELTRLRSELDESLAVARTIEERVGALLHDPGAPSPAKSPTARKPVEE